MLEEIVCLPTALNLFLPLHLLIIQPTVVSGHGCALTLNDRFCHTKCSINIPLEVTATCEEVSAQAAAAVKSGKAAGVQLGPLEYVVTLALFGFKILTEFKARVMVEVLMLSSGVTIRCQ